MQFTYAATFLRLVFLILLVCPAGCIVLAQSQTPAQTTVSSEEQTLQAVLTELRLLRMTTQRANVHMFRAQVILEKIRIQQEHVDRLTQQLDDKRRELRETIQSRNEDTARMKEFEERLKVETEAEDREQIAEVIRDLKLEIEAKNEAEQISREQAAQLLLKIQLEQTRVEELYKRLDALEKEVEISMPATPTQTSRP